MSKMSDFYYSSEECARGDLPVGCRLVQYLDVDQMQKKAAIIQTEHPIYQSSADSKFVVLAKGSGTIDEVFSGRLVGVYLLPFDRRADESRLDISVGLQPVKDWGALTLTHDEAQRHQVR